MEATIVSYKMGRHVVTGNQMIIIIDSITSREKAKALVGKKVSWTTPANKIIKGEIRSPHGNKGALRVLFEKGMPGQAVNTKVKIE